MGRLQFDRLSRAWSGEASSFTPLLAQQLDALGAEIGVDLASVGECEVATAGGRRIDIVAQGADGSEFVIENQFGRADHDHLTRGLAYAVARRARGLIVVAEEHRDEFRAVARYLNDLAESLPERGVAVWLVEAKAVRINDSAWAPLFSTVVEPNTFTATVEQARVQAPVLSLEEFWDQCTSDATRDAARQLVDQWLAAGHKRWLGPTYVTLVAQGPATNGFRSVVAIYSDGRVLVPFGAYGGSNSGKAIPALMSPPFRAQADSMFGFNGSERQARTVPGWLTSQRVEPVLAFCFEVADAYRAALEASES